MESGYDGKSAGVSFSARSHYKCVVRLGRGPSRISLLFCFCELSRRSGAVRPAAYLHGERPSPARGVIYRYGCCVTGSVMEPAEVVFLPWEDEGGGG